MIQQVREAMQEWHAAMRNAEEADAAAATIIRTGCFYGLVPLTADEAEELAAVLTRVAVRERDRARNLDDRMIVAAPDDRYLLIVPRAEASLTEPQRRALVESGLFFPLPDLPE